MLSQNDYVISPITKLDLTSKVVLYYDGNMWKIIPLLVMKHAVILYDTYYDNRDGTEEIYPISLVVCPLTLISIVLKGIVDVAKYDNVTFLHDSQTDEIFPINEPKIKRSEAKILTLKNAFTLVRDVMYIHIKKKITITSKYDKPLVYVIQYKSFKTKKDKYSIVIGKSKYGYDIEKSGVLNYLSVNQQKIINHEGYSFPCLLDKANEIFKGSRIVNLF